MNSPNAHNRAAEKADLSLTQVLALADLEDGVVGFAQGGTLRSLDLRGLATATADGYRLTDAGRAALAREKAARPVLFPSAGGAQ